jgi:thioredoxin-dependent peroxiredoxin
MRQLFRPFLMLAVAAPLAAQSAQMQGAAPAMAPAAVAPAVGEVAPDFTLPWADGKGPKAEPLTLSKLRGQVVVLAFYPADFSSGCTIEMTKFRDDYKSIFGEGVTVIPISHDSISTHARWVTEKGFPFSLASDTSGSVAKLYASLNATRPQYFSRTIYVIGKDGKIVWTSPRFNVNAQSGYDDLTAAIAGARK